MLDSDTLKKVTEVTPRLAAQAIEVAMAVKQPLLLVGAPGVGKTDVVKEAAKANDFDLLLSHPGLEDPTDVKGLPWLSANSDHAQFVPFGTLHKALNATRPTLWFLDDFGQGVTSVQTAYMPLLLDRQVAGHRLPDCVTMVAATNRRGDRSGVSGILEAVKSRFLSILNVVVSADDWQIWAAKNGVHPMVTAFLRFRPDLLHDFAPNVEIANYPAPRTWANVSKLLQTEKLTKELTRPMVAGAVGVGAAAEFLEFIETCADMPMPEQILMAPDKVKLPKGAATQYALASALAYSATANTFPAIVSFAMRYVREAEESEIAVITIKEALMRNPDLKRTSTYLDLAVSDFGSQLA